MLVNAQVTKSNSRRKSDLNNGDNIEMTVSSLKKKGYKVVIAENGVEALSEIKKIIPKGASVMNGSSTTLEQIGFIEYLKSGKHSWNNLHEAIVVEEDQTKQGILRKQATLSEFYLGSVHALTQDGEFVVASNSGSQLPHIVYSSQNLIFVVGTQKIVRDLQSAIKRLEDYVVPLEDKRMINAYGVGTQLNKIVIFKGESSFSRRQITFVLVKEELGF